MGIPNWDIIYWNDGVLLVVAVENWTMLPSTAPDFVVAEPISMAVDGEHPTVDFAVAAVDLDHPVVVAVDLDHLVDFASLLAVLPFELPIDISIPIAS